MDVDVVLQVLSQSELLITILTMVRLGYLVSFNVPHKRVLRSVSFRAVGDCAAEGLVHLVLLLLYGVRVAFVWIGDWVSVQ